MKKLVIISLFIFWAVITSVLTAGLVVRENNGVINNTPGAAVNSGNPINTQTGGDGSGASAVVLNVQEVAKHNSMNDCWLIINGKVYNITSYLGRHPGGTGTITPYCGNDATQPFTVLVPHSQNANNILAGYYLGDLNKAVQQQTIQNTINAVPPAGTGSGLRRIEGGENYGD